MRRTKAVTLRVILASSFVAATLATLAAKGSPVEGTWTIHANLAGHESTITCMFSVDERQLKGSCQSPESSQLVVTGEINGNAVTWRYDSEWYGQKLTLVFAGTIRSDEKLGGSIEIQPLSVQGDFTGTKRD
jgi:hypothetical protein